MLDDSGLICHLPPHLQLLEVRSDTFGLEQPDVGLGKVVETIVKSLNPLGNLKSVHFNASTAPSEASL